tara:strand:- start:672 stop:1871 length:1200 start_codon:yes stop_codon:yes gene_type:complete
MNILNEKKVLLIISGGIAAYKSLELIRLLKKRGSFVKIILTKNAKKFVTPLSVVSLSQEKVYEDLFDHKNESEMDHISLSRWADLILVAPATANTLAKLSNGIADNLATTVILASDKKILLVPAMNVRMWEHPSNKEIIKKLNKFGYKFIGPEIGDMACGEYGEGKMTEPNNIVNYIDKYFQNIDENKKLKALVTAGPTQEKIDPIRYLSNESSGKQGYEIARALNDNGFETTLISGPTNLNNIYGVKMIKVKTAEEMYKATIETLPVDVAIFSAAVADWKMKNIENIKIKNKENFNLNLETNIDILKNISNHNSLRPKIVIGFAAETNNLVENSVAKLNEKNCDWIIANDVSNPSIGFGSDDNEITIFHKNEKFEKIPKNSKSLIADEIVKRVISEIN